MRKLFSILILFALAPAVWAHEVWVDYWQDRGIFNSSSSLEVLEFAQGATVPLTYHADQDTYHFMPDWFRVKIKPNPQNDSCVVTADAVEVGTGTPLLVILALLPPPALEVHYAISWERYPANGNETATVRVPWRATGVTATGSPDSNCYGSGESTFYVTVSDPATATTTTQGTTTTTSTSTSTTTTASTTTTTLAGGTSLNLVPGWNLAGNGSSGPIDVATTFGDASKVTSVWKWEALKPGWAFSTPTLGDGGAAFASGKGYSHLTVIRAGEGFWVQANYPFTVSLASGTPVGSSSFQGMPPGWSMIAIGDNLTPRAFNNALSLTPPAAGDIPPNLTSLWAWNPLQVKWNFYAPDLDKSGGLPNYNMTKGYLDFGANTLTATTGFWVKIP